MGWVSQWWRQTDHYDRLSAHLAARGMDTLTRITVAIIAGGLSVVALGTTFTPTGPDSVAELACAMVSCVGAAIGCVLWATRWPARKTAIWFALLSSACIALIALAQSDPLVAMMTCATFGTLATYIALFHRAWLMAYNFTIAGVIGAIEGFRIAQGPGLVVAVCAYSLLLLLNLAVPFGVQVVVHVLGHDAVRAERDQLTGLFTRRAFHRRAKACLEQGGEQQAYVVVSVIDLDRFKQLNDNYGHSTGDDALVSVSRALRDTTDDTAVIGRSGGEEFVIADIWRPDEVDRRAQQLCEEIAALPFGITASIGTAGIHPAYRTGSRSDLLIELIAAADAAMYRAKRRGGNQAGHHEWPLPPPLASFAEDDYRDGVSA
ncbi:GGDEF domain-containing protein [Candidatus Mycobacterium wuenschmannii]|uniref:GGDEF domain-containing protein n=1 Tax=Candidatus Mycobacterium wuenschmannii TaxID=3027808 RepID=A0ABY8VU28_9MYCO|nr:GGDEF domain-containing protein [Candidatus Mycobacterium wuenschmannii]WIM86576.1 GGDEF domain-containing protein [Candidatus Mycobacterium wuenschmannii]